MDARLKGKNQWISHAGKRILFTDFRGVTLEDYFPLLDEAIELIKKETPNSVYTLSAHSKIHISDELKIKTNEFKKAAEGISKGTATFGLEGIQRIIAQAVKRGIYFAGSMEAALEWLAKQP